MPTLPSSTGTRSATQRRSESSAPMRRTGEQAVDTSNDQSWFGVRVDDIAVYYWHNGAVIRRLK